MEAARERRHFRLLCLGALVLSPVACSTRICSGVGASNTVIVTFDHVVTPSAEPISVTACVNGQCHSQSSDRVEGSAFGVEFPSIPSDATVHVSVRVRKANRTVFTGSTTTHTRKFQPAGPGCPPTVWIARVTAHPNGVLTG